ncbi:MAG: transcriptional regulator, partial [Polynucleobacter sp. 17-46-58]
MHALRYLKVHVKSKVQVQKSVKNLTPKQMESLFSTMAGYFGVLSEPTRLRIMYAVCTGEKTVSEVIELCGSSQANVSRHLVALFKAGILNRRKQGVAVYYSI